MSFKTQIRLEQITGSLPSDALSAAAAGTISATDISTTLDHLASAVKRIHGASTFSESEEGIFSVNMQVTGTLGVTSLATLANGLTVNGAAADFNAGVTANEIKIDGDTAGNLYIVGSSGEIADSSDLTFDGSTFTVNGDIDASSLSISGDTPTRLYIVGGDGSITDEAKLTFDGSTLSVNGALSTSGAATVGTDLTVVGNLTVQGTTTTLETQNLTVEDNVVLLGKGINTSANANGGLAIASGSSGGDALVFGRVANDTLGVGSMDVEDGTVSSLASMSLVNFRAGKFELGSSTGAVQSPGAGHLQVSGSSVSFVTADSTEMTAGHLLLAGAGEVAAFKTAFGDDTSIIAAISQAANAVSTKLIKSIAAGVSAGTAVAVSGLAHDGGAGGPGTVDVFVNGQLLTSGSSAANNPAGDDYYIHAGTSAAPFDVTPTSGQVVFTFDLQVGDVVTVFDKV